MLSFSRGSGSKIEKKDYKSRPITYVHKGKNFVDEVPAHGLLLQSSDAASWKECTIDYLKKHGVVAILDTYPAELNQLSPEFLKRLESEGTPKKAINTEKGDESVPVSKPVAHQDLHRFSATDLKLVSARTVFISREGYLESEETANMREGISTYLRTSAQGGFFEHVYTKLPLKNDVGTYFQLLLKEATVTNDMALFNAHLAFAEITMTNRNLSDLYTKMTEQAKIIKDLADLQEPPSTWIIHPKQMLCHLVKETMMKDAYYRAMAESGGLIEKLCTGNTLTPIEFVSVVTEKEKFYEQINPKGTPKYETKGTPNANFANPDKPFNNDDPKVCHYWASKGACRFADKCRFAHTGSENDGGKVNSPERTRSNAGNKRDQRVNPCANCDTEGHRARDCTKTKVICEFCKKDGHLKKFCHSMKAECKKKAAEMVDKELSHPHDGERKGGPQSCFASSSAAQNFANAAWDDSKEDAEYWEMPEYGQASTSSQIQEASANIAESNMVDLEGAFEAADHQNQDLNPQEAESAMATIGECNSNPSTSQPHQYEFDKNWISDSSKVHQGPELITQGDDNTLRTVEKKSQTVKNSKIVPGASQKEHDNRQGSMTQLKPAQAKKFLDCNKSTFIEAKDESDSPTKQTSYDSDNYNICAIRSEESQNNDRLVGITTLPQQPKEDVMVGAYNDAEHTLSVRAPGRNIADNSNISILNLTRDNEATELPLKPPASSSKCPLCLVIPGESNDKPCLKHASTVVARIGTDTNPNSRQAVYYGSPVRIIAGEHKGITARIRQRSRKGIITVNVEAPHGIISTSHGRIYNVRYKSILAITSSSNQNDTGELERAILQQKWEAEVRANYNSREEIFLDPFSNSDLDPNSDDSPSSDQDVNKLSQTQGAQYKVSESVYSHMICAFCVTVFIEDYVRQYDVRESVNTLIFVLNQCDQCRHITKLPFGALEKFLHDNDIHLRRARPTVQIQQYVPPPPPPLLPIGPPPPPIEPDEAGNTVPFTADSDFPAPEHEIRTVNGLTCAYNGPVVEIKTQGIKYIHSALAEDIVDDKNGSDPEHHENPNDIRATARPLYDYASFYPRSIGDFELVMGPGHTPTGYARTDNRGNVIETQPNAEACRTSISNQRFRERQDTPEDYVQLVELLQRYLGYSHEVQGAGESAEHVRLIELLREYSEIARSMNSARTREDTSSEQANQATPCTSPPQHGERCNPNSEADTSSETSPIPPPPPPPQTPEPEPARGGYHWMQRRIRQMRLIRKEHRTPPRPNSDHAPQPLATRQDSDHPQQSSER